VTHATDVREENLRAPLGDPDEPTEPFQISSIYITGPYPITHNENKYLLTSIDHFSKYAEAIPTPNQTADVCDKVLVTHIVSINGAPSVLISDEGRYFV
jgi:hypothetical protein